MNRTGTYVAFDGLGQADPSKSDFRYYSILQAWDANKSIDFKLTNSHEKTSAVLDTSSRQTLYARIRQRLSASKNMLIIISSNTRKSGSVLSYEIEQAIDNYKIPLIIAYPEYSAIWKVDDDLADIWPTALSTRIDLAGTEAIHIGFKKEPIMNAIPRFAINGEHLSNGRNVYSRDAYVTWEIVK
ncbi:MAG: TIR domain-containing protein [Anaerovoracaceae bacterium]